MAGWQDAPIISGGGWRDAPVVDKAPDMDVVATTDDGGVVYRQSAGGLAFTSPGYSTTDPAQVAKIMEGATPADVSRQGFNQQIISEAPVTARAVKAVEGVPFVGSRVDEAAGLMFGDDAKAGVRALSAAMAENRPIGSAAWQVGGSVAGAVPMAMAAVPALTPFAAGTRGAQALQAGIAGAVGGGIEGGIYGSGEGETPQERLEAAKQGAIFTGGAGAALGPLGVYASEGVQHLISNMRGSGVRAIADKLGVSPQAARVIKNALDSGDIETAVREIDRAGKGAMLADAGRPARELLDAAAQSGGAAGQIVEKAVGDRVTREAAELNKVLDDVLGVPSGFSAMSRGVRQGTSAARGSAYDAAYAQPIDYASARGQALLKMLQRAPRSAISDANELMRLNGEESAQILAKVGEDGRVVFSQLPDVRQIDYITRGLDSVAAKEAGKGKLGGTTPIGRSYEGLRRDIRNMLRGAVPEYGTALDVASDAISRVKAGEFGFELMKAKTTRETVRDTLKGMSKAERAAVKQGLRTYIDDMTANVKAALTDNNVDAREALKVLREVSSRANREKLTALLGHKEARKLLGEVDRISTGFELRAALAQNSKTAIRQRIQGAVDDQTAPGALETLASGKPLHAAQRFVQLFTGNTDEAQALRQAGIFEEIATVLTQTSGHKAKAALRYVKRAMDNERVTKQQAAFIGQVVATSGVLVGGREASRRLSTP